MKYNVLISDEYEDFINSNHVTMQQKKILDAKIKVLSETGSKWHCVYELRGKGAQDLWRLEYSRFRVIFFFGNENDLIICCAFIEKNKKDYVKNIAIAQKIKEEYYHGS